MIDSYSFGRMRINGRLYTADLIIFPDGTIQDSWWRRQGHRLEMADIAALAEARPDILVAGTGDSGLMRPETGLTEQLARAGITLVAEPSQEAAQTFNRLLQAGEKVGGCFHLTC